MDRLREILFSLYDGHKSINDCQQEINKLYISKERVKEIINSLNEWNLPFRTDKAIEKEELLAEIEKESQGTEIANKD